jgi:hypothetical protein
MDRIETIYRAIDQMAKVHNTPRPERFGGGVWNFDEEIEIWKKQIIEGQKKYGMTPLTPLQWRVIDSYIEIRRKEI